MISREQALAFAHDWIDAWNAHDMERILSHYEDDFEMSSPVMIQMGLSETGTLKGKDNIGAYWQKALDKYPDLQFKLVEVLSSVDTIVIYFQSINNKMSAEFLTFNEKGKVYKAIGHYN